MSRLFLVLFSWSAVFVLLTWSLHISINDEHDYGRSRLETLSDTNELSSPSSNGIVYIIRHGEKPEHGHGLSCLGRKRAQCILKLFGPHSRMNISYIIAAPSHNRVRSSRSIDSAKPVAKALDLEIDSYCNSDDAKCVAKRVRKFQQSLQVAQPSITSKNVLIIGRHSKIPKIGKALGVQHPPKFPDVYNLTWQIKDGQVDVSHQYCPELDDSDRDSDSFDCDLNEDNYENTHGYIHTQAVLID